MCKLIRVLIELYTVRLSNTIFRKKNSGDTEMGFHLLPHLPLTHVRFSCMNDMLAKLREISNLIICYDNALAVVFCIDWKMPNHVMTIQKWNRTECCMVFFVFILRWLNAVDACDTGTCFTQIIIGAVTETFLIYKTCQIMRLWWDSGIFFEELIVVMIWKRRTVELLIIIHTTSLFGAYVGVTHGETIGGKEWTGSTTLVLVLLVPFIHRVYRFWNSLRPNWKWCSLRTIGIHMLFISIVEIAQFSCWNRCLLSIDHRMVRCTCGCVCVEVEIHGCAHSVSEYRDT